MKVQGGREVEDYEFGQLNDEENEINQEELIEQIELEDFYVQEEQMVLEDFDMDKQEDEGALEVENTNQAQPLSLDNRSEVVTSQTQALERKARIEDLYINWLEMLIKDQQAISQLLQAETTHIEAFLTNERMFTAQPTRQEMITFQSSVGNVFDALNEKQRIHLKLIDVSFKLFRQGDTNDQ